MAAEISLGMILMAVGALVLASLGARRALPCCLEGIPAELRPKVAFIDRNERGLTVVATLGLVLGPALMLTALVGSAPA